MSILIPIIIL